MGGLDDAQQQARQGGLAATALAGDGRDRRLVLVDRQRDVVDGGEALVQQTGAEDVSSTGEAGADFDETDKPLPRDASGTVRRRDV